MLHYLLQQISFHLSDEHFPFFPVKTPLISRFSSNCMRNWRWEPRGSGKRAGDADIQLSIIQNRTIFPTKIANPSITTQQEWTLFNATLSSAAKVTPTPDCPFFRI
ncbi:hypothetical protein L1887_32037 [Cichorium endivia]|nr:hypothetical protein L1887_32037 [Cichorium endivia]